MNQRAGSPQILIFALILGFLKGPADCEIHFWFYKSKFYFSNLSKLKTS